jgi:hypothetical protein
LVALAWTTLVSDEDEINMHTIIKYKQWNVSKRVYFKFLSYICSIFKPKA